MLTRHVTGFILICAVLLVACSGAEPTEQPPAEATAMPEQPLENPEEQPVEPTTAPEVEPVAERPSPTDFMRELIQTGGALNPELVNATLFQLQSVPVQNGESYIFSFEDSNGSVTVACTLHTVLVPTETSYETLTSPFVRCVQQNFGDPISVFSSFSIDEAGEAVDVVFGQVYSVDVVAIRVFYDGGDSVAMISGGGYQANVPSGAANITVTAYDADGGTIFNGTPQIN